MPAKKSAPRRGSRRGLAARGYDAPKEWKGRRYTGMKIGGHHTWDYDPGVWKERKVEPDLWRFAYETPKRRKGKAPEGSGAPVGTEYHWYIVAHQVVKKLDANTYSTKMEGAKYKLAHRRADAKEWSARSELAAKRRELRILRDAAQRLEAEIAQAAPARAKKPKKGQTVLPVHAPARKGEA